LPSALICNYFLDGMLLVTPYEDVPRNVNPENYEKRGEQETSSRTRLSLLALLNFLKPSLFNII